MKPIKIFKTKEDGLRAVEEGSARRVVIGDLKICLARHQDVLYAIQDRGPHAKASLSTGKVNARGEIVCPLHNYCYDLETGREYQEKTADATVWRIENREDGVYLIMK